MVSSRHGYKFLTISRFLLPERLMPAPPRPFPLVTTVKMRLRSQYLHTIFFHRPFRPGALAAIGFFSRLFQNTIPTDDDGDIKIHIARADGARCHIAKI